MENERLDVIVHADPLNDYTQDPLDIHENAPELPLNSHLYHSDIQEEFSIGDLGGSYSFEPSGWSKTASTPANENTRVDQFDTYDDASGLPPSPGLSDILEFDVGDLPSLSGGVESADDPFSPRLSPTIPSSPPSQSSPLYNSIWGLSGPDHPGWSNTASTLANENTQVEQFGEDAYDDAFELPATPDLSDIREFDVEKFLAPSGGIQSADAPCEHDDRMDPHQLAPTFFPLPAPSYLTAHVPRGHRRHSSDSSINYSTPVISKKNQQSSRYVGGFLRGHSRKKNTSYPDEQFASTISAKDVVARMAPAQSDVIHTPSDGGIDHELTRFETEISPRMNPTDWLRTYQQQTHSIVVETLSNFTCRLMGEPLRDLGSLIYQRLFIYVAVHLVHCTDQSLFNGFVTQMEMWKAKDDTAIVQDHQVIRAYLLDIWRRELKPHFLHPESVLKKILTLDDIGLSAHLAIIISDDFKYKEVLDLRGSSAQALLNILQARLHFDVDSTYMPRHVKALIKLSRASRLYPECLVLKGIEMEGNAVAYGTFGDIYKGQLEGKRVAIKVLRVYQTTNQDKLLKQFSAEAVIWKQLSHPNVLPFYGVYHMDRSDSHRLCLVCPWMDNGNLVDFLANSTSDIDCVQLYQDVAQGLQHLHSQTIIHGDLKGLNILITGSHRACIADFGVATTMPSAFTLEASVATTGNPATGTLRWQAPELLPDIWSPLSPTSEPHNTMETDVYAFALVGYEIFSGNYPFHEIKNDYQVMVTVKHGIRPSRPSDGRCYVRGLTDEIWNLIKVCWTAEPSERPSAIQITDQLQALPNQSTVDHRPPDNRDTLFPALVLRDQIDYPFSTLVDAGI